jgi:hypothetical protein
MSTSRAVARRRSGFDNVSVAGSPTLMERYLVAAQKFHDLPSAARHGRHEPRRADSSGLTEIADGLPLEPAAYGVRTFPARW